MSPTISQFSANQIAFMIIVVCGVLLIATQGRIPLSYNWRNLMVRWRTTAMTALAFTLVIGLLVIMAAFVNGMYRLTESSGRPGNVIILSDGATDETFSNLGFSDVGDIENQPGVERDGDQPLCSRETYIVVNQPIENPPPGRPRRRFLQIRGIDDPVVSARVHGLTLLPGGQWFSSAGVRQLTDSTDPASSERPAIEVVVGAGIARELGQDRRESELATASNRERLEPGDHFVLGDRKWLIAGVIQSSGSTFDSEVWAKRSIVAPMFGKATYTSLVLRTKDAQTASRVKDFFNNEYSKAAVAAQTEQEYFRSLSETNRQFLYGIILVTVVLAVGGGFGIANTMFAAISQRTKDIGVLRLMGFARWQILCCFLLESVVIALIGGALGCVLGSLADGWTASSVVSSGQGGGGKFVVLQMEVTLPTLLAGMSLSVAMGFLGGLLPALSAIRLRPLEALR